MKRAVSLIITILIAVSILSTYAFASIYTGTCGSNVNWELDTSTGVLTLSGSGPMNNYQIYPETAAPWRPYRSDIKSVVIENGVTSIGNWAFSNCQSLTSIAIPDGVTSIGYWAFEDCSSLTEITIPNSVTSIGDETFWNCTALRSINVDELNTNYTSTDGVLFNKNKTKLILYPARKTNISYSVPDSVTSIYERAFYKCLFLSAVTIPEGVTSICRAAFYQCTALTSVVIPDSVKSIGFEAFAYCTALTSIDIPDSVTLIDTYAFWYSTSLKTVTIGSGVTSIKQHAFYNCTALTDVYYNGTAEEFAKITIGSDNTPFINATKHYATNIITGNAGSNGTYSLNPDTQTLTITGTGTLWSSGIDAEKRALVKTVIVNGFTAIGANVFNGANFTSLEKATISEGVTTLGKGVFTDCRNLKTVTLPSTLTTIGDYAFYCNKALTKIDIPANVTSIGANAFLGVVLTDINYKSTRANWEKISIADGNTRLSFVCCTGETRTVLDKSMGDAAYIFNSSLGKLFVSGTGYIKSFNVAQPMLLNSLAEKVKFMEIDDTLAGIGGYAFGNMYNLEEVTGGANMRYIGGWAFKDCASLKSVEFTKAEFFGGLNPGAFAYCSSLESIEFSDYTSIMYGAALRDCSSLKEITIPRKVKVIDTYLLWNCTSLEKVTILGAETIGAGAIQNCSALKELNLPETVKEIRPYAIFGCYALKTVNFGGTAEQWSEVTFGTGNNPIDRATVNCK